MSKRDFILDQTTTEFGHILKRGGFRDSRGLSNESQTTRKKCHI